MSTQNGAAADACRAGDAANITKCGHDRGGDDETCKHLQDTKVNWLIDISLFQ